VREYRHRERVVTSLNHAEPDRVPRDLGGRVSSMMEGAYRSLKKYLDLDECGYDTVNQDYFTVEQVLYRKEEIDFIKSKTDAKIFHHSCGSVAKAGDLLLDAGVDILNSLQPRAAGMDSTFLKDTYGENLSFHGGIDIQDVLPNGSPEDVEEEVKRRMAIYAPGGGYIVCAAHCIQDDVSPQNLVAMYRAADQWGTYPLGEELTDLRKRIPSR